MIGYVPAGLPDLAVVLQLAFPVPGVSYFWHPSDGFQANIGLPLLVL